MTEPEPDAGESPQEEKAEAKGEYVSFRPPKGFMPPEAGDGEGDQFDLVCSFKVDPDGKLCMTKLGDHDMPVKKEKEKAPDYKSMGQSIVSGTDQMMAQSNQSGY